MAIPHQAYSEYLTTYPKDSWAKKLGLNNAFSNEYVDGDIIAQTILSVTGLVKKNLHSIHNEVAADIQKDAGQISFLNGCKVTALEIGLLATALLLAPMETAIRTVIAAVVAPLAFIGAVIARCLGRESQLIEVLFGTSIIGVIHTAIHIPETAVSAFYSHLAHYNTPVNYVGHANYHVLCASSNDLLALDSFV